MLKSVDPDMALTLTCTNDPLTKGMLLTNGLLSQVKINVSNQSMNSKSYCLMKPSMRKVFLIVYSNFRINEENRIDDIHFIQNFENFQNTDNDTKQFESNTLIDEAYYDQ